MNADEILNDLLSRRNEKNIEGMKRFAIGGKSAHLIGISINDLRKIAKTTGRDHDLALKLWSARHEGRPVHEARLLAAFTAEPENRDAVVHLCRANSGPASRCCGRPGRQ